MVEGVVPDLLNKATLTAGSELVDLSEYTIDYSIDNEHMFTTNPDLMLMYGKEASNRKQEIDRQHYTIPNQRPKDKHCGKI